jgi:hypothetical protein
LDLCLPSALRARFNIGLITSNCSLVSFIGYLPSHLVARPIKEGKRIIQHAIEARQLGTSFTNLAAQSIPNHFQNCRCRNAQSISTIMRSEVHSGSGR